MSFSRPTLRRTLASLFSPLFLIGSIYLLVVLVVFRSSVWAEAGTLDLKASTASYSGTMTQAGNQPIRTAFGPLRLDYKSGPNNWTTGFLMREGDGNISIGANITSADFYSTSKLRVLGIVESTNGGFKFPDGTTQTSAASGAGNVPNGAMAYFNAACPTGWSEVTGARGRVVVGVPASGTLAGTVGTALTDLQNPTHTHTTGDLALTVAQMPSHSHSNGGGGQGIQAGADYWSGASGNTGSAGGGAVHNHGATGATSATPPYIQYRVCQYDGNSGADASTWGSSGNNIYSINSGNVGIGSTTPGAKLEVAGNINSSTGAIQTAGVTRIANDGVGTFAAGTTIGGVAPGAETAGQIAFFAAACPTGWTEYTAARGMYIVGNPSGGTLATGVGTALTNLENRAVGQHNHGVTDPGHFHSFTAPYTGNDGGGLTYCPGCWNYVGFTGSNTGSKTTGVTVNNSGSVAGTNAPYIQLTACQKN